MRSSGSKAEKAVKDQAYMPGHKKCQLCVRWADGDCKVFPGEFTLWGKPPRMAADGVLREAALGERGNTAYL